MVPLLALVALGQGAVARIGDALAVPAGGSVVRLIPLSPYAVRVVRDDSAPQSGGMARDWNWTASASEAWLRTAALRVRVDRRTGRVVFYSLTGRPLGGELAERALPLAPSEAIFGPEGDDGALDRRGSVSAAEGPVAMLSSRGYGVFLKDPATVSIGAGEEGPISPELLFDDDAKGGALTGRYYEGREFDRNYRKPLLERRDTTLDFDWSTESPPGLPQEGYCVRWIGAIEIAKAGRYRFAASADDGARLFIDGVAAFDSWTPGPRRTTVGDLDLGRGRHEIRFEYFHEGDADAAVRLTWRPPTETLAWTGASRDYTFVAGPSPEGTRNELKRLMGERTRVSRAPSNWEALRAEIPAELGATAVGVTPIEGTAGKIALPEAFIRWFQYVVLRPGPLPTYDPAGLNPAQRKALTEATLLRTRLEPFLRTRSEVPIPPVVAFAGETRLSELDDEALLGPLLLCPVVAPRANSRVVTLPETVRWTDFWTGVRMPAGANVDAPAPLGTMPIYVRAGTILPIAFDDAIELRVVAGADGKTALVEGDVTVPLAWEERTRTLTLGRSKGALKRPLRVVLVAPDHGVGVNATERPEATVEYRKATIKVRLP